MVRDEFLAKILKKQKKLKDGILEDSAYGRKRKKEIIGEPLKRKSFGPMRSGTCEEMTDSGSSIRKKSVMLNGKTSAKKEEVSPNSPYNESLSISPASISYRKVGKKIVK